MFDEPQILAIVAEIRDFLRRVAAQASAQHADVKADTAALAADRDALGARLVAVENQAAALTDRVDALAARAEAVENWTCRHTCEHVGNDQRRHQQISALEAAVARLVPDEPPQPGQL